MDEVGHKIRMLYSLVAEGYGCRIEEKKVLLAIGASVQRWMPPTPSPFVLA